MKKGPNSSSIKLSEEAKKKYAESAARSLEDLVARLKADRKFATTLQKKPRETLEAAGIRLEKEAIELFIAVDPDRFDRACDALFDILDPDFLTQLVRPSCDTPTLLRTSRYDFRPVPRKA